MEKENHIDRALAFMENLEKLGAQLQKADEQQKLNVATDADKKPEQRNKHG